MSNFNNLLGIPQGTLGSPINCVVSGSSGSYSLTGSLTNITNMNCTIYTTGDYPVQIRFIPDGTNNTCYFRNAVQVGTDGQCHYYLYRSGTLVGRTYLLNSEYHVNDNKSNSYPPGCIWFMDFPPKGTWTYQLQGYTTATSGSAAGTVEYLKMVVYEDRTLIYK